MQYMLLKNQGHMVTLYVSKALTFCIIKFNWFTFL